MKKNISVIIPHKNIPCLLERCLKSIPQRDNIQVIVVDDFSTPEVRSQLCLLERKYRHVIFIYDKLDLGAGHARNIGLSKARGEWVIFSDADDFFELLFWDKIDDFIKDTDSDVLYFKARGVMSDTLEPTTKRWKYEKLMDDYIHKRPHSETNLRLKYITPWGKIIRRSLIEQYKIRFEEIPVSNDLLFSTAIGVFSNKITANDFVMYNVTWSPYSLTSNKIDRNIKIRFEASLRQYLFVESLIGEYHAAFFVGQFIKLAYRKPKLLFWCIKTFYSYNINVLRALSYFMADKISSIIEYK